MNRITNAFILVLLFPLMALVIFVAFDLPLGIFRTTGAQLPLRKEIIIAISLMIAILFVNRSVKRWMALHTVSQKDRFVFNVPLSKERKKRIVAYGMLESLVYMIIGIVLAVLSLQALPAALLFLVFGIEGVFFIVQGKNRFAIGLSRKAIIVADREVSVIYYTGLRKVSISQQTLYFDYLQSLQLCFPIDVLPEDQRQTFTAHLEEVVDPNKVLIQNLGSWRK